MSRRPISRNDLNKFDFRPVGQGLFYTGSLMHGRYNFVFDCGTESKQKYVIEQIDDYVASLGGTTIIKPVIDFVVISHLHSDHFSGLYYLLKKCDVKEIILPYLGENKNVIRTTLTFAVYGDIHENEREDDERNRRLTLTLLGGLYGLEEYRVIIERDDNFRKYQRRVSFINRELGAEERDIEGRRHCLASRTVSFESGYWQFNFIQSRADIGKLKSLREKI